MRDGIPSYARQVSAMNTNNMSYGPLGYITYFLRLADDFRINAERAYGMHDAIQISVNTDGDHAHAVEYDRDYPFQYWNAEPSWCLLPIYEYWQCYGNQKIPISDLVDYYKLRSVLSMKDEDNDGYYEDLTDEEIDAMIAKGYLDLEKDILLPLLTKQANFWEQIVTPEYYMDENGKASYQKGKTALNPGEKYMIIPCYSSENNPIGYNSTITANATMDISAAKDGLKMEREPCASGQWARKTVTSRTITTGMSAISMWHGRLMRQRAILKYMTDHNSDRGSDTYCTDTSMGLVGTLNEMMLFSNTGQIQLCPALPSDWTSGSVDGLMA